MGHTPSGSKVLAEVGAYDAFGELLSRWAQLLVIWPHPSGVQKVVVDLKLLHKSPQAGRGIRPVRNVFF